MPPSPNKQEDPYDFILNHQSKPSRNISIGSSPKQRFIIAVVGALLLIIISVIVSHFLGSSARAQKDRLVEVAQAQTEIVRLTSLAEERARDLNTLSFAVTTQLTVESSQQEIKGLLDKRGVNAKALNKIIGAKKNAKSDALLDEAEKNNRFDETFVELLNSQLTDYSKLLDQAHSGGNRAERKALESAYLNTQKLQEKNQAEKLPSTPASANDSGDSEETAGEDIEE